MHMYAMRCVADGRLWQKMSKRSKFDVGAPDVSAAGSSSDRKASDRKEIYILNLYHIPLP